jgi:hypothetical protein
VSDTTAKGRTLERFRVAIEEIIPFLQPAELVRLNDARGFLVVLGGIPEKPQQVERLKALAKGLKAQAIEWVHRQSPPKLSGRASELREASEAVLAGF